MTCRHVVWWKDRGCRAGVGDSDDGVNRKEILATHLSKAHYIRHFRGLADDVTVE